MPDKFYIIDGHSCIYRNYFANFQRLSGGVCPDCDGYGATCTVCGEPSKHTSSGGVCCNGHSGADQECLTCHGDGREPTKATFLFTKQLLKLLREKAPAYIAMTLDGPRHLLLRRELDPTYKGNRNETDREVICQVKRIRQIVEALGIPVFQDNRYEADDLIATLARGCVSDDVHVVIISRDHDLFQLLDDPRITMFDPIKEEVIDGAWVEEHKGYRPEQALMLKALMGCPSDHVKGVPGCGEKTAQTIVDSCFPGKPIFPDKVIKRCGSEQAALEIYEKNLQIVKLMKVPMRVSARMLAFKGIDLSRAKPIFHLLGFKRWE